MNIIPQLEFEPAPFETTVQHVSHYAMGTPLVYNNVNICYNDDFKTQERNMAKVSTI